MTIRSFGSFEEMQKELAADVTAAQARIQPFQRILADGKEHWFLRLVQFGVTPYLLVGRIFDADQLDADNRKKYPDAEPDELDSELEQMLAGLARGFAFTEVFSTITPLGELGDTHIATMIEITKYQFDAIVGMDFDLIQTMDDSDLAPLVLNWIDRVHYQ